jgi:hypothetical protein
MPMLPMIPTMIPITAVMPMPLSKEESVRSDFFVGVGFFVWGPLIDWGDGDDDRGAEEGGAGAFCGEGGGGDNGVILGVSVFTGSVVIGTDVVVVVVVVTGVDVVVIGDGVGVFVTADGVGVGSSSGNSIISIIVPALALASPLTRSAA